MPDRKETISRLEESFYVDNCVTSVTDKNSLNTFIQESVQIMAEAKFDLRGWERTQYDEFGNDIQIEKYEKIVRMMAWILRLAYNSKKENRQNKNKGPLLCKELIQAEEFVFKTIQNDAFARNDPRLRGLEISKHDSGVMRLTTKISNRKDNEHFCFPIILPNKHVITRKLVIHVHEKFCHVGVQGLIGLLREKILDIRRPTFYIIGKCKVCRRFDSKSFQVPSPPLPTDRVREAACFEITGVDLAGPLYLKSEEKVWILLTVVLDCESVINSRPLTYQSNDAKDLVVLTPNMFLRKLTDSGVPDCDAVDASSLCKRVRNLQKNTRGLTEAFSKKKTTREVALNEIVLIGSDNIKRMDWPVGRVLELLPGKDGRVRLVRVMTSKGQLLRPVQRLFPLEMNATSEVPQDLSETSPPLGNVLNLNDSSDDEVKVVDGSEVETVDETQKSRSGRLIKLPKGFAD
ncbi:hypothetical protein NQ317_017216 [Molorchus minor]|uniref:DUF5641 domain-containing protein n=1 Tax=Molorchus minor TaxID=1323400 RepID=A0ABQ9JWH8_9CUCU|nr:hypothetical protein NQ317_017216 [Molorchus minor]